MYEEEYCMYPNLPKKVAKSQENWLLIITIKNETATLYIGVRWITYIYIAR